MNLKPNASDKTPVVHIGMPKTATKTLQWRIFAQHSELFYLGRYDGEPFKGKYREFKACRDATVFRIMNEIAYQRLKQPNISECRELLDKYLAENNQSNLVPVWSWESYSTDSRRRRQSRAENLKQLFVDAKIVITIRHPVKLLESAFLQQLKRDNIGGRYWPGRGVFYSSIDDWIDRDFLQDVSDHLDYPETIRMYVEQFGRDNVCVLVFEDLLKDSIKFYQELCGFMGIDSKEALSLVAGNVDNSRWTEFQLERLRSIDSSLLASLRFRFSKRIARKNQLGLDKHGSPIKPGNKAKVEISRHFRNKVVERTRQGNEWLDQVFDLDLSRLDYYK